MRRYAVYRAYVFPKEARLPIVRAATDRLGASGSRRSVTAWGLGDAACGCDSVEHFHRATEECLPPLTVPPPRHRLPSFPLSPRSFVYPNVACSLFECPALSATKGEHPLRQGDGLGGGVLAEEPDDLRMRSGRTEGLRVFSIAL